MIPGAPILASSTITIAAPADVVWGTMTDVAAWEGWHPYLKDATLDGPFAPGGRLSYGGLIKHRLVIAKVAPRRTVMLCGKMMGYSGVTRWELEEPNEGGTTVTFTESSRGLWIGALYSDDKLAGHLGLWLRSLKAQAERNADLEPGS